jgi:hypothetical protein
MIQRSIITCRSRVFEPDEEGEDGYADTPSEVLLAFRAEDLVFVENCEEGGCWIHLKDHGMRWVDMPFQEMVTRWQGSLAPQWVKLS